MKINAALSMITLALEFSSSRRSVAVLKSESPEIPPVVMGVISDEATRAAPPPVNLVASALERAAVDREAVDRIVVGLGPGSYTGIRSAIALAQGWQLARPIQLMGLSSVECLAAQAYAEAWFGEIGIAIDAQRNEVYFAGYEISSSGWRETKPLRLATLADVHAIFSSSVDSNDLPPASLDLESGRTQATAPSIIGPEVTRWFPAGRVMIPCAAALGRLAYGKDDYVAGEMLEPIYLRQTAFVKAPPPRVLE
jgi:tRNA threonylcarbamoyl adenosine modification protein YeaZ